jgi:hypothetical protein
MLLLVRGTDIVNDDDLWGTKRLSFSNAGYIVRLFDL